MTTPQPYSVAVLVSGSGTLLQSILDHQDFSYRVVLVVADKQCPALERAKAAGVTTRVVEMLPDRGQWNQSLSNVVAEARPDVVVSAGFMKILGAEFLERFEGRTINTHPALLPSFPGAHAVRDAMAYGVKVTGSTVHFVDSGVDTGKIIAQRVVEVKPDDTEASLHERIKVVERALIVEVLRSMSISSSDGKLSF
ncbi:phosphoribosylglycinamide formyltransferase [Corynebacterium cystitidis]|uniref:Phosphoribosylglycinamide formyltransferase n=1 Tax=Corynebacterium cystitidis DSM 20524 TaxID=1121357 RepID=A0A1H9TWM3_9CORY|nr:phosphoribosylglycinamide formyltransferase [Corynebacterium cystitidis]WJY81916.1 Phosphoribosylglycinamide formyltransferase [Corynebacterium cystitidis DSM 20524]SES01526.1 phosphoribosylglycinamide formyltransferase-1 [Corynebacterium cystitidis DSM 20524]SNV82094.1 phosphoribosylglycinamide formyltransferase [Corynebacterium cystitidis]